MKILKYLKSLSLAVAAFAAIGAVACGFTFATALLLRCIALAWHAGWRLLAVSAMLTASASALRAQGVPVFFSQQQISGYPRYDKFSITADAAQNPQTDGTNLIGGQAINVQCIAGGNTVRLMPGGYTLTAPGWSRSLHFVVNPGTNTVNVVSLITNGLASWIPVSFGGSSTDSNGHPFLSISDPVVSGLESYKLIDESGVVALQFSQDTRFLSDALGGAAIDYNSRNLYGNWILNSGTLAGSFSGHFTGDASGLGNIRWEAITNPPAIPTNLTVLASTGYVNSAIAPMASTNFVNGKVSQCIPNNWALGGGQQMTYTSWVGVPGGYGVDTGIYSMGAQLLDDYGEYVTLITYGSVNPSMPTAVFCTSSGFPVVVIWPEGGIRLIKTNEPSVSATGPGTGCLDVHGIIYGNASGVSNIPPSAITGAITTNLQFTFNTTRTNTLYFTNGILLRVSQP